MQKNTLLSDIKKLLKRRLIIIALASILMVVCMAGLSFSVIHSFGKMNDAVTKQALPLFESSLEVEVNVKGMILGASKYADLPLPEYYERIEDSYQDIQQVLPAFMLMKDMGHAASLEELHSSINQIHNIAINIVDWTDALAKVNEQGIGLIVKLDTSLDAHINSNKLIDAKYNQAIKEISLLKTSLLHLQEEHSRRSLSEADLLQLEDSLSQIKDKDVIDTNTANLLGDLIEHYQKINELYIKRQKALEFLYEIRQQIDYLLDEILQPDAKKVILEVQQEARNLIIDSNRNFLIITSIAIGILLVLTIITIREFIKVLAEFFQVMEQLSQGDFSLRVDTDSDKALASDVKKMINDSLEKLQALTVAQPYTDTLWQSTSGGLLLVNSEGVILRVNDVMQKLLVSNNKILKSERLITYFPSIELHSEGMTESRTELISGNGETIPVILSIKPVYAGHNQDILQGYFCAVTDLRHDVKVKQRLYEQAEGLRAVLDTVTDAIIVIDGDSRIIFSNAKTEWLFGYRNENLLNEHLNLIMPEWVYQVPDGGSTPQMSITQGRDCKGNVLSLEVSVGALIWQGRRALVLAIQSWEENKKS